MTIKKADKNERFGGYPGLVIRLAFIQPGLFSVCRPIFLVPTRRVGMQKLRAAEREYAPQRGETTLPRSAWEREKLVELSFMMGIERGCIHI
jgi:hypothetical protein